MILDGASFAQQAPTTPPSDLRGLLLSLYPDVSIPPLMHTVATAEPLIARVNHGVWKASCSCGAPRSPLSAPGCIVWLADPRGFCVRCLNRPWGGGWRSVIVPPELERAQIEAVLLCRPDVTTRNWEPGETVAQLVAENEAHGVAVPDLAAIVGPEHGPRWQERVTPFSPLPRLASGRLKRLASSLLGRR